MVDSEQVQYIVSGGTFLGVATYGIRFIYKLQVSGENIYERRSDRQVATIKDLEDQESRLRKEMADCHAERLILTELVSSQRIELSIQKKKLETLEKEIEILRKRQK